MFTDKQHATLLILLDLNTTFDTDDHQILLNRLCTEFGVSGKVIDLSIWGFPKAVVYGPLLFFVYSSKLFNIVNKHLPNVHAYADDTQLYLAFKPGNYANETAALSSIQSCIRDVQNWMLIDELKLNPDKTEFLILGTTVFKCQEE